MFDLDGNVIGINSQILAPTGGNGGIGFAIPAETAVPIIETLKKGRSIKRGYLGVGIGPMSDDLAESLGLPKNRGEFVGQVVPGEAAAKAGIKAGDVVVRVNGEDVTPDNTLSYRSEEHTSELQSLMRISYAVFCLKKKNTNNT